MSGPLVGKPYPFIDIAVLDGVRERLAAGEALCILTSALNEVVWSNASGARLLGFEGMDEALGSDPLIGPAARRQIEAAGGGTTVAVRLSDGASTRLAMIAVEKISLPDGGSALLLAEKTGQALASTWIEGLDGDGVQAAVIGAGGEVIASSSGFPSLGVGQIELAKLAGELRYEADRMVKRLVPSARGMLPAGIGLVGDEPPRGLLLVVDSGQEIAEPVAVTQVIVPESLIKDEPHRPAAHLKAARHYFAAEALDDIDLVAVRPAALQEVRGPEADGDQEAEEPAHFPEIMLSREEQEEAVATEDIEDEGSVLVSDQEEWPAAPVLIPLEDNAGPVPQPDFAPDIAELPVRFAWRMNAQDEFCEVSPELARAVGPRSADILGRTFRDVAQVYDLDPGGQISDLIERRDTWSGRSVLWPVEGTDLRAPVDLAALPVYDRDRQFDGFKGFGIVRVADAVIDADATGLALTGPLTGGVRHTIRAQNPDVEEVAETPSGAEPAPRTEKPVLIIAPKLEQVDAADGKVIRLEARRAHKGGSAQEAPAPASSLSEIERSAFREIAERLRESEAPPRTVFGKRETVPYAIEDASSETSDFDRIEDVEEAAERGHDPAALEDGDDIENLPEVEQSDSVSAAGGDARLKYEAMLRDLIETVEKPVAPEIAGEIQELAAAPLDYDAMLREILETADKPPIDGKMIRVMPAEEILRVAEEHHQQQLESLAQDGAEFFQEDFPLAATDDPDLLPAGEIEPPEVSAPVFDPPWPEMSADSPTLPPRIDIEPNEAEPRSKPVPDTSLLRRLPAPLLIYGGRRVHFANPAFLETTGYGSARELEILGGIDQLIAGDDPDEGSDRISIRIKGNGVLPFNAQIRSVPWDGNPAMMLTLGSLDNVPAAAEPVHPQGDSADIVSDLRRHAAELTSILDTATDGVVIMDVHGRIRSLNQSAEALFGFDPAEVAGKPFSLLLATESQRMVNEYIAGMAAGGVASIMNDGREVIGREARGRFIPLFLTIGRLEGSDGYCAVLRDMTQWKRAEEELITARRAAEEASNTKSEFLTRVSHEIRTPLNAIIGFSELMAEERFGPVGNPRYLDYAKDINRSGCHVLDLVNDLLDISKIEAGEQEMNFAAVALNEALAEAVALMQPQANRERVIIRSSFASTLPDVVADLRSIKQIALNLLSNAVRYTGAGGQVIVSTAYELTGDVVIRVRDTGAGMTQADIEQAMKPFKQLNTVKRGRGDGTGLGLPLTKALVEGNRARFSINSTPGKGTLVEITFPSMRVLAN